MTTKPISAQAMAEVDRLTARLTAHAGAGPEYAAGMHAAFLLAGDAAAELVAVAREAGQKEGVDAAVAYYYPKLRESPAVAIRDQTAAIIAALSAPKPDDGIRAALAANVTAADALAAAAQSVSAAIAAPRVSTVTKRDPDGRIVSVKEGPAG